MAEADGSCGFLMWGAALLALAFVDGCLLGCLAAWMITWLT